ncbi:hypothetical protein Droror1_Dr00023915 [Drosera rotundifolia]
MNVSFAKLCAFDTSRFRLWLLKIGFGVELSSIVTRVVAELKNGLVSCASECPVGFARVEASKRHFGMKRIRRSSRIDGSRI